MQVAEAHAGEPESEHRAVLCCRMTASHPFTSPDRGTRSAHSGYSFLRRKDWYSFAATLERLRDKCATAQPVIVRTSWLPPDTLGDCVRRKKRFVVRLNRSMNESQAVETLLHEWAHALAWNYSLDRLSKMPGVDPAAFDRACHDEAWGCAYSRVWRAYLEVGG